MYAASTSSYYSIVLVQKKPTLYPLLILLIVTTSMIVIIDLKRLDSEKSSAILFHCEEYDEVTKHHHIPFKDPRPEALQVTTDKEIKSLVDNLKQCTTSCGLLDLLTKSDSARAKLPPTPKSV